MNIKAEKRIRRHRRIRAKVKGTALRPRLSVYRSNRFLYGQLIDDETSTTLFAITTKGLPGKTPGERAKSAGEAIAKKAKGKKIAKAVFDRGGFRYAGAIKAFADGAREGGLTF
jgi:large subunit ribosomal protein L18